MHEYHVPKHNENVIPSNINDTHIPFSMPQKYYNIFTILATKNCVGQALVVNACHQNLTIILCLRTIKPPQKPTSLQKFQTDEIFKTNSSKLLAPFAPKSL
jgi:hypothetical protein